MLSNDLPALVHALSRTPFFVIGDDREDSL
jgi:hypothetical protein